MKITEHSITIGEIAAGYVDNDEKGVIGYGGRLNIRPEYQREFVYDKKNRDAVIETVMRGFPLNVMYWVDNGDGTYEVLDGQQRTVSFCQYVTGVFSKDNRFFHNLTQTEQQQILNYKVLVYFCEGNDREKLDWFKIVNLEGKKLLPQELRNAVYTGPWLSHAKSIFSKTNGAAYNLAKDYVSGSAIRQEILETALKWINKGDVEGYMAQHQHDPNANELWLYFKNVIDWTASTFPVKRREMKSVNWGELYDAYHGAILDTNALEKEICELMLDDDVDSKSGIYPYVLTRDEKHLNLRTFSEGMKRAAYERQKGLCPYCVRERKDNPHYSLSEMDADHIIPWSKGGKTNAENCQLLCRMHNRRKSDK